MLPLALIDTSHGASWIAKVPRDEPGRPGCVSEWVAQRCSTGACTSPRDSPAARLFVAVIALLIAVGGDRRTRAGAHRRARRSPAFVVLAPLLLGLRRAGLLPVAQRDPGGRADRDARGRSVRGAARAGARRRAGGRAADHVLVGDDRGPDAGAVCQRPDWRNVAHALGPARYDARRSRRRWNHRRPAEDLSARRQLGAAAERRLCGSTRSTWSARTKRLPLAAEPTRARARRRRVATRRGSPAAAAGRAARRAADCAASALTTGSWRGLARAIRSGSTSTS